MAILSNRQALLGTQLIYLPPRGLQTRPENQERAAGVWKPGSSGQVHDEPLASSSRQGHGAERLQCQDDTLSRRFRPHDRCGRERVCAIVPCENAADWDRAAAMP